MSTKIRHEEHATLGDFIKTSFVRDQDFIMEKFPKLNEDFLTTFTEKLEAIKVLESRQVLTQEQKIATASLHAEVVALNKEMNFLNLYISAAGLHTNLVSDLKIELAKSNIEGAIAKIEGVRQFIAAHSAILQEEGMTLDFPETLDTHKTILAQKNAKQNELMNTGKTLVETNRAMYDELYNKIVRIADAGKLIFDGTITEDEYVISKIIGRMRAPKHTHEKPVTVL